METPNTLTDELESAATPAELKGKVQALLQDTIPVPQAKELAKHLVEDCGYDTPDALREMDLADLVAAVPAVGHRKRVSRALFSGAVLTPAVAAAPIGAAGAP